MAAIGLETIQQKLGALKVTRVMPNTPSLYGEGVSLILHSQSVTEQERSSSMAFFSACSKVHQIADEEMFDKVTTVSGSGPAYVFYFAKTMADQLEAWGMPTQEAREVVVQLFKGSTKLMELNKTDSLQTLIDQVTSKGGVTIEAVKVYQEKKLNVTTQEALSAAYERSKVLTKELK